MTFTPNLIPVMDDPLGKHWDQPSDVRFAPMDETHVILTPHQTRQLAHYNSSMPSGVYPGKVWGRKEPGRYLLAWYGPETPDHKCPIMFREILEVAP